MKNMSEDKEFQYLFKSIKDEIPDKGFSQEVMNKLPKRLNILPYLIIVVCAILGLSLTLNIVGVELFVEQIYSFALSLSRLEMPSISSITTYIVGLILLSTVSFAIYRTDTEFM